MKAICSKESMAILWANKIAGLEKVDNKAKPDKSHPQGPCTTYSSTTGAKYGAMFSHVHSISIGYRGQT